MRTTRINNRRYLGNKYSLLPFIKGVVDARCPRTAVFADLFSGTGAVSSAFQDSHVIITNDILYSNYLANMAWFGPGHADPRLLAEIIGTLNAARTTDDNYMSENFADTYFSADDCRKIGYIREEIGRLHSAGEINGREFALLVTSLLYAMDRIARTCGHYDAYRRTGEFTGPLELPLPLARPDNNPANSCHNRDITDLAPEIQADIVYLDPPYNSRQYCDTYHLLENVARWEKPALKGVARKFDRSRLKSAFCTGKAPEEFARLIQAINARYILLSYNNMSHKGDNRSNARISDSHIMEIFSAKGRVEVFSEDYRPFSAGKSSITDNQERIFLCHCR